MVVPRLLPTAAADAAVAGMKYHISGELVPVLQLELGDQPVYFEHHILLWKDPDVQIGVKSLSGAFNRMLSGMPIFMTEARGPGRIAFSRDAVGHIFAVHLSAGHGLDVREHQFLAATDAVEFTSSTVKGFANIFFGGSGLLIDHFFCRNGDGAVWLYGYGNVFEANLGDGEQIDIEPGGWVYKERRVQMDTAFTSLTTGLLSGTNMALNRFTGPGRVGFQSMYYHPPTPNK
ncbi:MAG TPA: AIM24 family protein [Gemmataceae bacterium]|nr:AIM24 family protein [Gemmataceae bacterium]